MSKGTQPIFVTIDEAVRRSEGSGITSLTPGLAGDPFGAEL